MAKDWTKEAASADNPLTPVPLEAGTRAYLDCFSGAVPVIITEVYRAEDSIKSIRAKARVTADHGAYKKGEIIESGWSAFYPRQSRVRRGHEYRIRNNYHPVITER